ncbi:hypothetical protein [Rhodococcus opacus]|nr:hypothetical protein [Rhodococcus opacus]
MVSSGEGHQMPLYEFRCAADCGPFERSFQIDPGVGAPRSENKA